MRIKLAEVYRRDIKFKTWLSAALMILYILTYVLQKPLGYNIVFMDFFAAAGCMILVYLLFGFLPKLYFVILTLFICACQYFGMMWDFYSLVESFDTFLHLFSGAIFSFFGLYFYELFTTRENRSRVVSIFFGIGFAHIISVGWEIYEFSVDNLFGFNTQIGGLVDTMVDLIASTIGSLFIVVYVLCKNRKFKINQ